MSQSSKSRLLSFQVGDEERLIVGAVSAEGRRTIYEGHNPDEYAIVPTSQLVEDQDVEEIAEQELCISDLRVVGGTEIIDSDDERDVELHVDGEKTVSQGAAGIYGLLWIPLSDV